MKTSAMTVAVCKFIASAATFILCGATAYAQSALDAVAAFDMPKIERFVALAQAGSDQRVSATMREQFAESGPNFRTLPPILVSIEGEPAFVYVKERWSEDVITFVMRCRGSGIVDLSFAAFASRPMYSPEQEAAFDQVAGQIMEFGRGVPAVVRLTAYEGDAAYDMPVAVAFTWPGNESTDAEGNKSRIQVQLAGAANSNDQFFRNLRGTTLQGFSYVNGQHTPLRVGVDLPNVRTTVGPLLEHCRAGNDNPMDRVIIPMADTPGSAIIEDPREDLDLSFLDASRSRIVQRIYQGLPADMDVPLEMRLTVPLAFHLAYSRACGAQQGASLDFVYTDIFVDSALIAVPPDDFATLFEATQIYGPVMQRLYDERVRNDFTFREVQGIYQRAIGAWSVDWKSILDVHGCTGAVIDRFRHSMKSELPFVEYARGSKNALVDFGIRQYEIAFSNPIDIETARQIGLAESQSGNDAIFGNSYAGRILRAIAVGNFAQVEEVNGQFRELISNPLGSDPDNPVSKLFRLAMELESAVKRDAGVLTAYAIGRTYHLGACGDPTTTFSQDTVYWTEYINGFGQHLSSSPSETRTSSAEVPAKFAEIVRANDTIDTSWVLDLEMARIVGRLSCDSPARKQLEDNMIAYFSRRPAVHIGPVPAD
ncbi:hypothetical protein FNJ84_20935 [Paracoccus sp. M683]|uniref:hypothetical protein n=1 Tax=Paracoccus sp. M683 TaxID=2594268 RepID=UPI00117D2D8A|nr:hypothetical protein [Paracoccus sp. M683]TRW92762.1 hypothetical protein FNJ84_20935 [Paracoccus sp. M683]